MINLKNDWLELGVSDTDGCLHSLRMMSVNEPKSYEFVEKRSIADQVSNCLWGQWEVHDSFTTIKPSDMLLSVTQDQNTVLSKWDNSALSVSVQRELHSTHLAETVTLQAKQTLTITDFHVAFRPVITNFLDASNVAVGEHSSHIACEEPHVAYHWFTGGHYAHLMLTEVTGKGPHLGICLVEGRIHGLTTPYLHGGSTLVNDYLAYETHQMYPRLHVTSYAAHKENDEYPQPLLDMRAGDSETFTLFYFRFENLDDFPVQVRNICKQPSFQYPRFWYVDKTLSIDVQLPTRNMPVSADYQGKPLRSEKINDTEYEITFKPEQPGLHKINISYGDRQTFILLEAIHDVADLLEKRVNYILSSQQCLEPSDPRYAGIFMTDMPSGKWVTCDDLYTVQVAGSGEMVTSGQLIVYKNLIDPDPDQIWRAELYANHWLRQRCQDEDFATPLNPLNRLKYKPRGWKYKQGLAKIFHNPDFKPEKAWRVHNANWIAPFYYLLSEIPERLLTMQSDAIYLDWAYRTYLWFFETEPQMSADQSYFIPRVIQKLRVSGRDDAAAQLEARWQQFVIRLQEDANSLKAGFHIFDDSMYYCSAIPLLLESKVEEARHYLSNFDCSLGLSYDPRVQTMFRYWDDYLTNTYYLMMPALTRPHFWSITDSYPLLQLYELTHDEAVLNSAYQGILAFYEHYNFGYRWNKWGEMQLGQGHPGFLPSLDLHTQERTCADQDPAFVTYLETFGSRCYLTPSGKALNASWADNRLESWAPFPREYHLDDRNLLLTCKPHSLVIPWIEFSDGQISLLARNLSRYAIEGIISLSGQRQKELLVTIAPYSEMIVSI